MEPRSSPGSGTENHTYPDLVSRQLILSSISTTTSGSFLTMVNHCQSAASVCQSALRACIPLRQAAPSFTENETEISFFNRDLYENFKLNPQVLPCSLTVLWGVSYLFSDSMGILNFIQPFGRTLYATSSSGRLVYNTV